MSFPKTRLRDNPHPTNLSLFLSPLCYSTLAAATALPPKHIHLFKEILRGFIPQLLRSMLPSYFCIFSMVGFGGRKHKSMLVYHVFRNQKSLCFSAEELSCFPLKSMRKKAGCRTFSSLKTSSLSLIKQGNAFLLLGEWSLISPFSIYSLI